MIDDPMVPKTPSTSDADRGGGLVTVGGHRHTLAGGEPIRLDDDAPVELVHERHRLVHALEATPPGGRDASFRHDLLREGLRPLDAGGCGVRAEDVAPGLPQRVTETGDQRRLRSDRDQVDIELVNQVDHRGDVVGPRVGQALGHRGDPRFPGAATTRVTVEPCARRQHACSRPPPPTTRTSMDRSLRKGPGHPIRAGQPATTIVCSRAGPTPIIVTGTPPRSSRSST